MLSAPPAPLCSVGPESCAVLSHSLEPRKTRTSLGSRGTSELPSSSLGEGGEGWCGGRGGGVGEPKGVAEKNHRVTFTHNMDTQRERQGCISDAGVRGQPALTSEAPATGRQ